VSLTTLRAALVFMGIAASLHANGQLFRAYLASYGSDANPCTLAAPCRLLPAALNVVASHGEVWMLDSANFNQGTVNITKSVSILAVPGEIGSFVAANGTDALSISTASVAVSLRNVVVTSSAAVPGNNGITATNGEMLSVEDSLFANLPNDAIHAVGPIRVHVRNTVFRRSGDYAIWAQDGVKANVATSQFVHNAFGLIAYTAPGTAQAPTEITLSDSQVSGDGSGVGVFALSNGSSASFYVTRSTVYGHSIGVDCAANSGTALVTLGNSTITGNTTGVNNAGSAGTTCKSLGNNQITDNGTDIAGALSTTPLR